MQKGGRMIIAECGRRIRLMRKQLGWTQCQLGKSAGLSQGFLSDVENGKLGISFRGAVRLAHALGVSPGWLGGDGVVPSGTIFHVPCGSALVMRRQREQDGAVCACANPEWAEIIADALNNAGLSADREAELYDRESREREGLQESLRMPRRPSAAAER